MSDYYENRIQCLVSERDRLRAEVGALRDWLKDMTADRDLLADGLAKLRAEVERMRPVYEAAKQWWDEGVRPRIPYRSWSTKTTEALLDTVAKHFAAVDTTSAAVDAATGSNDKK